MKFISTRGSQRAIAFSEAVSSGLASDGGLYVPEFFPKLKTEEFSAEERLPEFASRLLRPFFAGDPLEAELDSICAAAFNFPIPLRFLDDQTAILELFHGPTAAFKDVGARFLAECVSRLPEAQPAAVAVAKSNGAKRTVIVATSGDTGGAVAGAFAGRPGFDVVVLFPKGRISKRQEKQIACWGPNVHAFAVRGTFDDCQRVVKEALSDPKLSRELGLFSANSISVGRLLPQMIYYATSSLQFQSKTGAKPGFIVPSGNLGNAVAALWAKRLGFPIERVVLATNANRTISDYFKTGVLKAGPTIATLANAMDVGQPSNMERLLHLYPSIESLRHDVAAISVGDAEITTAIETSFRNSGEIYCPHTATAVRAREIVEGTNWILVSTAHPAKFETIVEPLIGKAIEIPGPLASLLNRECVVLDIEPSLKSLAEGLT